MNGEQMTKSELKTQLLNSFARMKQDFLDRKRNQFKMTPDNPFCKAYFAFIESDFYPLTIDFYNIDGIIKDIQKIKVSTKQVNKSSKKKISENIAGVEYGVGSYFVPIYLDGLYTLHSFQMLSATEKMVLIDIINTMNRIFAVEPERVKSGITYTFSQCKERISHNTFDKVRSNLVRYGFITVEKSRNGNADRIFPCEDYKTYVASESEKQEIDRYAELKLTRVSKDRGKTIPN